MNRYTIYCTEEQTKKAIDLGAPIKSIPIGGREWMRPAYLTKRLNEGGWAECPAYYVPTAEQMIGWLEEQESIREVNVYRSANYEDWYYSILGSNKQYIIIDGHLIASVGKYDIRKEATLAAIDSALDYLIKNKK